MFKQIKREMVQNLIIFSTIYVHPWNHKQEIRYVAKKTTSLVLCLLTLAAYSQVGNHEFVNFDDIIYLTNNTHVNAGITWNGIKWAFTEAYAANWHPLTWLSHMLDCQLYGLNPAGHHLTSLVFHIANTLLLFHLFWRLTGAHWRSAAVAALFAIHPLHVESVAWVAERKDVLSTLFFMLALLAYVRYVERMVLKRYLLVLFAFVAGLLSKPMLVTLPFLLLLLDYWPLGRMAVRWQHNDVSPVERDVSVRTFPLLYLVREKLPFFVLSVTSCLITYHAQQKGGTVSAFELLPFVTRLENALFSYAGYMGKMLWPDNLVFFYPLLLPVSAWRVAGACMLILSVSAFVVVKYGKRPYLAFGWLWYLVTLVPVIGLVQVGAQAMADRYTYIPLIGLFVIVAWGMADLVKGRRYQRIALSILSIVAICLLTLTAWRQAGYWKNDFTLYNQAISITDKNFMAQFQLGNAYASRSHFREAVHYYLLSLESNPNQANVHYNLGLALTSLGNRLEAAWHYSEAISIRPNFVEAYYKLALLLLEQGKIQEAKSCFIQILQINPDHVDANYHLSGNPF